MKEEKSEMQEIMRNAQPSEVGGILRKMIGAREAAERRKRTKFRNERRRFGKEHELPLSFAISRLRLIKLMLMLLSQRKVSGEWLRFWKGRISNL